MDQLADQAQIAGLKASLELPAKDYLKAHARAASDPGGILDASSARWMRWSRPDAPAPRRSWTSAWTRGGPPAPAGTAPGFQGIIPAGNLAGLPALVLPCGFAENLPVALQMVGVPFSENTLLAIGKEFQARTDWHKRRPPGL